MKLQSSKVFAHPLTGRLIILKLPVPSPIRGRHSKGLRRKNRSAGHRRLHACHGRAYAYEKAKDLNPALKVIVVSAYDTFDYVKTALRNGAENYLLKPLNQDELVETLQKQRRILITIPSQTFMKTPACTHLKTTSSTAGYEIPSVNPNCPKGRN